MDAPFPVPHALFSAHYRHLQLTVIDHAARFASMSFQEASTSLHPTVRDPSHATARELAQNFTDRSCALLVITGP